VEPNFPFINIPPPQSHGATAAQAFAEGTGLHLGRRVKIDYSQSAQGGGPRGPGGGKPQNDGTRDIGNSPSAVVLLRGLDPMSTLDVIAEALKASSGAAGQGASGMKRIVLIRDRYTAMGIGLAFVEFVDTEVILIDFHLVSCADGSISVR
jgi:RNA-binding protein 5/10